MKPIVLLLTILICALNLNAQQTNNADDKIISEVVIQIPNVDALKKLPVIKQNLKNLEGYSFKGFCESKTLLFLTTTEVNLNGIEQMLVDLNIQYFIKHKTGIAAAMRECSSMKEVEGSLIQD